MSGAIKLSQDIATLINNRQGSDVQFKVGGGDTSTHDESATMTFYAHSVILRCRSRYFAAMLDEEKNWKESSDGVIYKPNISPSTFQDVLHYIYTGDIRAKASENIVELIAAADEMDLEELSAECQKELIRTVKDIFSDDSYDSDDSDDSDEEDTILNYKISKGSTEHHIPIDVAIRTHIIPALNLASSHSLSHLSKKLFGTILPNIFVISNSSSAYTTFVNNISFEVLTKIIASDNLIMSERNVWDMALRWACHQTNLSESAIKTFLANLGDGNEGDDADEEVIDGTHLDSFKAVLAPLLQFIRFSLLTSYDYELMADALNYLLPRRRFSELNRYFITTNRTKQLDVPRAESVISSIIVEPTAWVLLRRHIFESNDFKTRLYSSTKDLKFELLFRASEHDFLSKIFHQRCDKKGPTLTIVRSADGHLFGGVNFAQWTSDEILLSPSNFLFALPDGNYRKDTLIFKSTDKKDFRYPSSKFIKCGPCFMADLFIVDSANSNNRSYSKLPSHYKGRGASNTALAGTEYFTVSDYEVFAISK